ncbi:thioredoxin domain-containing protein [Microbacterium sp. RU33B]|uniref:thioredoxin domain-containing protein n=1 Tax=Microbacterium sp. RU33B TaxID=1907390 RepID=UPI0009611775|nr:DUF255 domain-containing protein [Microbacterium sp. RU33B]SIT70882.1 hypothetical protein SAMN05880545_0767 [Microbacterium sp. RU33B]
MNERLAATASPYLRAHADNPVAWFPWGEEAFAEARRRDVPVMVSIGYSTCHWCHVMARESFQDAATAAELDAGFVAVKVDREEHPDVDAAYMAAAAAFTPHLGWPLTVFTTPDGGPFYAGTYFPPEPRAGLPSFRQVLGAVRTAWEERRAQVDGTADAIRDALADVGAKPRAGGRVVALGDLVDAAASLAAREDPQHGGFGDAPKFPIATALRFLQALRTDAPDAAAVADRALAAMAASELRDPVEGGFFRYATQRDWSVPHYERMLTDNALLLDVARESGDQATAQGVAGFLVDVMQQPSGGFAAAQDSESWIAGARSEGGYYARGAAERIELDPPAIDGKIVTGWNGLAIGALARAGARRNEPRWIDAARRAADAVLEVNVQPDGMLLRASLDEIPSRARATLADYGQLAAGLVALAIASGEPAYAVRARELVRACIDDDGTVGVPGGGDAVLAVQAIGAPDAASDGDEPSGPSAIAEAAVALWLLGAGEDFRALAERLVAAHAAAALAQPIAHGALLGVAAGLVTPPRQVVVVAVDAESPLAAISRDIRADVVVRVTPAQAEEFSVSGFALFDGKALRHERATAYDCRQFSCRVPVGEAAELSIEP